MPDEPVRAKYGLGSRHFLLGVASVWDERKGLADFVTLSGHLAPGEALVLVGLTSAQAKGLPGNIVALPRTESISDLAALYSAALALVNPTYADNFPTTNLEALACGTPVITYDTGGSPEAVDESTGAVVPQGNVESLAVSARRVMARGKVAYAGACRERAVKSFDSRACYRDYLGLYEACVEEAAKSQREK
jgi:glycosyltransferase involved in cell wall biosynthesis